jgi:hypothetical protein
MGSKRIFDSVVLEFLNEFSARSDEIINLPAYETIKAFIYNEKHRHYLACSNNVYNFLFDERFINTLSLN